MANKTPAEAAADLRKAADQLRAVGDKRLAKEAARMEAMANKLAPKS